MKTKDEDWYQEKIQDIKKIKRKLRHIQDSKIVKRIKNDLIKEKRAAKRAEKQNWKKKIKDIEDEF